MVNRQISRQKEGRKRVLPSLLLPNWIKTVGYVVGLILIGILFFVPIGKLVTLSFMSESGFTFNNYIELSQQVKTWKTVENTMWIIGGSTLFSVIMGGFLAWLIAYSDVRGKRVISLLIMLSFIIPSYVAALSWIQLMNPNGMVADLLSYLPGAWKPWNLYSYSGIIFVMGLHHFPLVYMLTVSVLRKIPRELEWACRISGAGPWKTFQKIILPLALPGLASGGLLAFLASLDNFGIPAFLGIPGGIRVMSTAIYEEVIGFGPAAFAKAASLSVILGVMALVGTGFQWLLLRRSKLQETIQEDYNPRFSLGRIRPLVEGLVYGLLIVITFIPLVSLFGTSFIKAYGLPLNGDTFTLANYQFILVESTKVQNALSNSFSLAVVTMVICLIGGTVIAYYRTRRPSLITRGVEVAVGLPYALPGVVFALAMIFTWMEPIPGWKPDIYGTVLILYIAYVSRFMMLQVRGSITAMLQVDKVLEEAAQVCGAGYKAKWRRIMLPLLLPGTIGGGFLVLLSAFTELTVSSLLFSSGSETIGVVMFNFEQAGYTTYSAALSGFIVTCIFFGIILLYAMGLLWKRRGISS